MKIDGFSFSAVEAGIRYNDRLDLGLMVCEKPCPTAGVFTTNQVKAAPVLLDIERLQKGVARAILVNSGCANACTGEKGMETARLTGKMVADLLHIPEDHVLLSSTGVIGEQLNINAFENNSKKLVASLGPENFRKVALAIMTTDTVMKTAQTNVKIGDTNVKIVGMAKGSGMIMPDMATMLSFIFTDAKINPVELKKILLDSVKKTLNRVSVDGDTSTNDMTIIMAGGTAANNIIDGDNGTGRQQFLRGLESVLRDLALQIVRDGEGATKTITIKVEQAKCSDDAEKMARTIANSSLVKTAFFGEDANWGRILMAMGRSGVIFSPEKVDISFDDIPIVRNGVAVGESAEESAGEVLKKKSFTVNVNLHDGVSCEEVYTCDFSIDYVKINADYRS